MSEINNEPPTGRLEIEEISVESIRVPIVGTAPLITHNWSEKAKRMMLDKMQKRAIVLGVRDPDADYRAAFYRIAAEKKERYGFPVAGFLSATVGAARFYDKSVTMTSLKQFVFMSGLFTQADPQQLVEIFGEPRMREDVVRIQRGTDLRYRPEFSTWRAELDVTYVTSSISRDSVLRLIDAGGMCVGVGEWRPQKGGQFGTYTIDQSKPVEVL